jgi:hypothetical protein
MEKTDRDPHQETAAQIGDQRPDRHLRIEGVEPERQSPA